MSSSRCARAGSASRRIRRPPTRAARRPIVFTLHDGQIVHMQDYLTREAALAAARRSERRRVAVGLGPPSFRIHRRARCPVSSRSRCRLTAASPETATAACWRTVRTVLAAVDGTRRRRPVLRQAPAGAEGGGSARNRRAGGMQVVRPFGDPSPSTRHPREAIAVRLAKTIADDPRRVDDELFAELRVHFTDEELVELVAMICMVSVSGQTFGAVMAIDAENEDHTMLHERWVDRQHRREARPATAGSLRPAARAVASASLRGRPARGSASLSPASSSILLCTSTSSSRAAACRPSGRGAGGSSCRTAAAPRLR